MKIKGRLLKFEKILMHSHYFPRKCEIEYQEKIPLLFNFSQEGKALGIASVERDNDGLIMTAHIFPDAEEMIKALKDDVGIGGFYKNLETGIMTMRCADGIAVLKRIDKCQLVGISLTPTPIDSDFKYDIVYEENLHAEDN